MRRLGFVVAVLGAAAMTFAGLMKVFNTTFRGDMAENYDLFGSQLPGWFLPSSDSLNSESLPSSSIGLHGS